MGRKSARVVRYCRAGGGGTAGPARAGRSAGTAGESRKGALQDGRRGQPARQLLPHLEAQRADDPDAARPGQGQPQRRVAGVGRGNQQERLRGADLRLPRPRQQHGGGPASVLGPPHQPPGVRGFNGPNSKKLVEFKDFKTNAGYFPYLINDIAAAKVFLDRKNDEGKCNTHHLVLVGETGAALGACGCARNGCATGSRTPASSRCPTRRRRAGT